MKKIAILLTIILFSSCYTVKDARQDVLKAHAYFPITTSGFCATTFPSKDSIIENTRIIQGKDRVITKEVLIDCDSVVKDTINSNKVVTKWKYSVRTDTVVVNKEIYKENTAKLQLEQIKYSELQQKLQDRQIQLEKTKEGKNIYMWLFIIVTASTIFILWIKR